MASLVLTLNLWRLCILLSCSLILFFYTVLLEVMNNLSVFGLMRILRPDDPTSTEFMFVVLKTYTLKQ